MGELWLCISIHLSTTNMKDAAMGQELQSNSLNNLLTFFNIPFYNAKTEN